MNKRASVIVSQNEAHQNEPTGLNKYPALLVMLFFGLSASVLVAEMLDLVEVIEGHPYFLTIKVVTALMAGLGGGFAAARSGLFGKRKTK